jgi:hypothetical protein
LNHKSKRIHKKNKLEKENESPSTDDEYKRLKSYRSNYNYNENFSMELTQDVSGAINDASPLFEMFKDINVNKFNPRGSI